MGKDTHALSEPAQRTALEVLAANGVETIIQRDAGVTPTPVISWAILVYNRGRKEHLADGIVVTPSHNPPEDGGFKYNPPNGGPADIDVTGDRKSTRLNSSHSQISYAVFCLKKKKNSQICDFARIPSLPRLPESDSQLFYPRAGHYVLISCGIASTH